VGIAMPAVIPSQPSICGDITLYQKTSSMSEYTNSWHSPKDTIPNHGHDKGSDIKLETRERHVDPWMGESNSEWIDYYY
jgi:hypothetical protein